jgi:hypothetical protein
MRGVSKAPSSVFISYSMDAKRWAQKLSNALETKGVSTWADFKSIRPGQRWLEEIEQALDDAQYFILVVGPKNAIGEWQDREWQGALQRTWTDTNKRILPVLVDDAPPPPFLKDWTFVRMQPNEAESSWLDRIYDAIFRTGSRGRGVSTKQGVKRSREFRNRLEEIESVAKQLKSSREQ